MAERAGCIVSCTMVRKEPWKHVERGQTGYADSARPLRWLDDAMELVAGVLYCRWRERNGGWCCWMSWAVLERRVGRCGRSRGWQWGWWRRRESLAGGG